MPQQLGFDFSFASGGVPSHGGLIAHDGIRLALQAMESSPWPAASLMLVGPKGSGKTLIAITWAQATQAQVITPHLMAGGPDLLDHLFGPKSAAPHQSPTYIIDDLDHYIGDAALEHGLFCVFNHCMSQHYPCVWTSTLPPAALAFHLPDLASRLRAAPLYTLSPPGDDERIIILAKLFSDFQLKVDGSILKYVVTHGPRDLHGLSELMNAICAQVIKTKKKVSLKMLHALLQPSSSAAAHDYSDAPL